MKAVLLVTMGGAESESEVKYFLKYMFLDKNILDVPLLVRMFLSWRITSKRYKKSWQRYQDMGGTDIRKSAQQYAERLTSTLGPDYLVESAFLYSLESPLIKLQNLVDRGITDITVVSLFPHPCICTNGQVRENIQSIQRKHPEVSFEFVENMCEKKSFHTYWKTLITDHIERQKLSSPFLLFTAHSIPQSFADKGDKYQGYVVESARVIADDLGLDFDVGFQSRLGKAQWLSPETKKLLEVYKDERVVVMVPISFVCENLETKFDIDVEFIPFAKEVLGIKNISRISIPVSNETLLDTIKDAVLNND